MKKTMLTYKTLDRFEREYKTEHYTPEQIETIEHAAYVANMNQCNNPEWTEADIFADFIRVLGVHKIETEPAEADETETENNEEEETMMNELKKYVDGIRDELKALYELDITDEEREKREESGDPCSLYDYFDDVLDIEYTIDSQGEYLGARVYVTLGGPNVWIDTCEGYVKGAWGTDREESWIPSEINDEINDIFREYYDCIRG